MSVYLKNTLLKLISLTIKYLVFFMNMMVREKKISRALKGVQELWQGRNKNNVELC